MPGGLDYPSQNCKGGKAALSALSLSHHFPPIFHPLSTVHLSIHLSHRGTCQVPAAVLEPVFPVDHHLPQSHILFLSSLPLPFSLIWTYSWDRGWWPHSSPGITNTYQEVCVLFREQSTYAVLSTLQILTHFTFIPTLWSRHYYCYSHFIDESIFLIQLKKSSLVVKH